MAFPKFDVLRASASELRALLEAGSVTSVDLVKAYLTQISLHNHAGLKLHAIISTAPESFLLEQAHSLDVERQQSGPRSRLHGIPILIKDQFCSPSLRLPTTGGSLAFKGMEAKEDSALAILLKEAGSIVIGTTNLSELGNSKGYNITSGWSPLGGQTQSPYVEGGVDPNGKWLGHTTPAGSSSGSAVGVAAGFAPWAIGTETDGSIIQPALRAAVYGLKPTVGATDLRGAQAEGSRMSSLGGLAKTTKDLADLTAAIIPGTNFDSSLTASWEDIRIAYLDPVVWHYPDSVSEVNEEFDKQSREEIRLALAKAETLGAKVSYDAPLTTIDKLPDPGPVGLYEVRFTMEKFLANFKSENMRTLEDLIQFNKDHADEELPGNFNQDHLERAAASTMTAEEFEHDLTYLQEKVRESVENCLEATKADVIIASGESLLSTIAMGAGYPVAALPLGFAKFNGRPFGVEVLAKNAEEDKLFKVMSAWEATFPEAVKPPPLLISHNEPHLHAEL